MKEYLDLEKLTSWARWIEPFPVGEWKFIWIALGICLGLIILAIIRKLIPGDQEYKQKIICFLITLSLAGMVLIFFRWQSIPYFSARVVWLGWLIWLVIWGLLIIYYRLVALPKKILKQKIE